MTTWLVRFPAPATDAPGDAVRVAVKDAIDMAGVVTSAGCAAVRDRGQAAGADAACLAGIRSSDARIVGKTNLTELCLDPNGVHHAFGTPVNPAVPDRIPGGSSSGSAVAVADGEVDIALGTDTGGSVRIPAACCGIVGLKTTWGRISTAGVWPLAPSLDTVGPLARDVAGVTAGMRLLEPGWTGSGTVPARVVGRLRIRGAERAVEDAVDAALDTAGMTVHPVHLPGWEDSIEAFGTVVLGEFWRANHALVDADGVSRYVNRGLHKGRMIGAMELREARAAQRRWRDEVMGALAGVDLLALPTLVASPPRLTQASGFPTTRLTAPFNLAGVPALTMPVPAPGLPVPASLQLVAAPDREDLLCATGAAIEAALGGAAPR